ncbi:hypothetical protein CFP56_017222 [Quercus suber]|uniref:Uncharacterized protein n=1 Tax=Quercus suber TaxID=58331 RepID=A0AAW0KMT0_QUESU
MHDILYISLRSHLSHSHRPDPLSYLAEAVSLVSKASPTIALSHMFNALGIVAAALDKSKLPPRISNITPKHINCNASEYGKGE